MAAHHQLSRTGPTTREWDAAGYDRVSDPRLRWAAPVLDRLRPDGLRLGLVATRAPG